MTEPRGNVQLPPPTPIGLVLCDNVYRDSRGKQALIGLFNRIFATKFPATHPRLCAYIAITSIRPDAECKLEIVEAESDVTIFEVAGPAPRVPGPTAVLELVFELNMVTFPRAGRYYVKFFGNGQLLMQRHFDVITPKIEIGESHDDTSSQK